MPLITPPFDCYYDFSLYEYVIYCFSTLIFHIIICMADTSHWLRLPPLLITPYHVIATPCFIDIIDYHWFLSISLCIAISTTPLISFAFRFAIFITLSLIYFAITIIAYSYAVICWCFFAAHTLDIDASAFYVYVMLCSWLHAFLYFSFIIAITPLLFSCQPLLFIAAIDLPLRAPCHLLAVILLCWFSDFSLFMLIDYYYAATIIFAWLLIWAIFHFHEPLHIFLRHFDIHFSLFTSFSHILSPYTYTCYTFSIAFSHCHTFSLYGFIYLMSTYVVSLLLSFHTPLRRFRYYFHAFATFSLLRHVIYFLPDYCWYTLIIYAIRFSPCCYTMLLTLLFILPLPYTLPFSLIIFEPLYLICITLPIFFTPAGWCLYAYFLAARLLPLLRLFAIIYMLITLFICHFHYIAEYSRHISLMLPRWIRLFAATR